MFVRITRLATLFTVKQKLKITQQFTLKFTSPPSPHLQKIVLNYSPPSRSNLFFFLFYAHIIFKICKSQT